MRLAAIALLLAGCSPTFRALRCEAACDAWGSRLGASVVVSKPLGAHRCACWTPPAPHGLRGVEYFECIPLDEQGQDFAKRGGPP